ncbi:MAG TPA: cytochrome c3 family protein [Terriglobales bacterium]|nr:cytochrome c3 family protein [Terriglobales bacterium]
MAQIFHRSTNTIARFSIFGAVFLVAVVAASIGEIQHSLYVTGAGEAQQQPVPFSHQHHVAGLGLDCRYCHTAVETSSYAGIPPTQTCMNCHAQIWTNAAMLEPVRASFRSGQSLHWIRVNDLPDFVYFDHSIHIHKGIGCDSCHGPVDRMPLMYQAKSLQMDFCLDCHRAPQKYIRPRDQVFNMEYQLPSGDHPVVVQGRSYTDQAALAEALLQQYQVRSVRDITSCSTCHR